MYVVDEYNKFEKKTGILTIYVKETIHVLGLKYMNYTPIHKYVNTCCLRLIRH